MSVITNTTVISNFASIGQLDLLRQLFGAVYISVEVQEEIQTGLEEGYRFYADINQFIHPFVAEGWIKLTGMSNEHELSFLGTLLSQLHRGEASSLAIARYRQWTFLTDDQAARDEATNQGVQVSGTLGCLVLAVESNLCTLERNYSGIEARLVSKNLSQY